MSVIFFKNRNCMSIKERNTKYKTTIEAIDENIDKKIMLQEYPPKKLKALPVLVQR